MENTETFFTVKDIAKMLRVSPALIYEAVALGKLRCFRIATKGRGTIRVTQGQVAEFLRECEPESSDLDLD
jgi:hypothetical protein